MSDQSKILVVDDDPDTLELLTHILTEAGYQVLATTRARQALEMFDSDIDAVIADIIMPDMDGLELIGTLRKKHSDIRILAYSGGSRYLDKEGSLALAKMLGARRVLNKDDINTRLIQELDELLKE